MPPNMARKERFSLDHAPIFFSSSDRQRAPPPTGLGGFDFLRHRISQAPAGKT
jgi:hypothetical protein